MENEKKDFYGMLGETAGDYSVTENGMPGYRTSDHPAVDFVYRLPSYRADPSEAMRDFRSVLSSPERAYALRLLFYVRDAREGLGERGAFRACLADMAKDYALTADILGLVPEYGRWDDLIDVAYKTGGETHEAALKILQARLLEDLSDMHDGAAVSLLAKWMPSENASNAVTKDKAKMVRRFLGFTPKEYRKTLSALRAYLGVVEAKMSAGDWKDIDYDKVPSKANIIYGKAFLRNDEERRRAFLDSLSAGDGVAKINGAVNFPSDIVSAYGADRYGAKEDPALEALWKALKPSAGLKNTVVVRDGSGSMQTRIGCGRTTALDVSTALAVYCAECSESGFKDRFITFSHDAELVDLSDDATLFGKLRKCYEHDDCSNTDIKNVFDLILRAAVRWRLTQDELPDTVLVISDMEFDDAASDGGVYGSETKWAGNAIEAAEAAFAERGYRLPRLVFWNVASRTNTVPVKENADGVVLVSGFSQNALNMVANGESDPWLALKRMLDGQRYQAVPLLK